MHKTITVHGRETILPDYTVSEDLFADMIEWMTGETAYACPCCQDGQLIAVEMSFAGPRLTAIPCLICRGSNFYPFQQHQN